MNDPTIVRKLEALLDAIGSLKGFSNPDSVAYQIKNPLLIKSFARPGKHNIDGEGRRIFESSQAGYKACWFDLDIKTRGESRAGLKPDDKLSNLLRVFGLTERLGQQQVVKFLRRALLDETISLDTPLTYFRH
jgi:hypothetical protein